MNRARTCSPSVLVECKIRTGISANALASSVSASLRTSFSRVKSAFGSRISNGSSVCRSNCSNTTPTGQVFPEPLCPHQKVCLLNRSARRETPESETSVREPIIKSVVVSYFSLIVRMAGWACGWRGGSGEGDGAIPSMKKR